jgi:hypothetical protein
MKKLSGGEANRASRFSTTTATTATGEAAHFCVDLKLLKLHSLPNWWTNVVRRILSSKFYF